MKRTKSIFLAFLFILYSSGMCFSIDICSFQKSTTLSIEGHKSCCGDEPCASDCCKEVKVVLKKINDNYNPVSSLGFSPVQQLMLCTLFDSLHSPAEYLVYRNLYQTDKSPPNRQVSLNILFNSFLI